MIRRLAEEERLSGAVVHAATVYLAGQIADDTSLDAEGADGRHPAADRRAARRGRDQQALSAQRADLPRRHGRFRGDEPRLGRLARPAATSRPAPRCRPSSPTRRWRVEITGIAALPPVLPRPGRGRHAASPDPGGRSARLTLLALALLALAAPAQAQRWVTSWAGSAQGPYPSGNPSAQPDLNFAFPDGGRARPDLPADRQALGLGQPHPAALQQRVRHEAA